MAEITPYPFVWSFCLRTPLVLGNQPAVLCFSAKVPVLFRIAPGLLFNYKFSLNFIFQTSKHVYFISFSYELQI
jgi:hypothetical protein